MINEQKVENDLINDWIVCHTSFRFTTTRRKSKKGGDISWMLAFVSIHMACEYTDKIWVKTSSKVYYVIDMILKESRCVVPPKDKSKITIETFLLSYL